MNKPRKSKPAMSMAKDSVHPGSGNVFADLGLKHPDQRLAKAALAQEICTIFRSKGLDQKAAAKQLGIDQPKVSALMRGQLKDFSTERLMRFLTMLGCDVTIVVRQRAHGHSAKMRVMSEPIPA